MNTDHLRQWPMFNMEIWNPKTTDWSTISLHISIHRPHPWRWSRTHVGDLVARPEWLARREVELLHNPANVVGSCKGNGGTSPEHNENNVEQASSVWSAVHAGDRKPRNVTRVPTEVEMNHTFSKSPIRWSSEGRSGWYGDIYHSSSSRVDLHQRNMALKQVIGMADHKQESLCKNDDICQKQVSIRWVYSICDDSCGSKLLVGMTDVIFNVKSLDCSANKQHHIPNFPLQPQPATNFNFHAIVSGKNVNKRQCSSYFVWPHIA